MSDDIQRLVESLRSPGLESELRGESFAVDAIASTMTAKDASMINRFSKKARVASFVAAGIIGFGGVAAAGPTVMDQVVGTPDEETEPVAIEEESTDEGTEEGAEEGTEQGTEEGTQGDAEEGTGGDGGSEPDEGAGDSDDAEEDRDAEGADQAVDGAPDEIECDPDKHSNHGKYVSEVARTKGRTSQQVVEAAHSTCGKKTDDAEDTDENEEAEDADEAVDDAPDEIECDPDKHSNHGKYVSEVARTKGRTSQQVVEAAQSTCGKKTDDGDSEGAEEAEDADKPEDEEADDGDETPDTVEAEDDRNSRNGDGGSGRGNGNSGNGKANGNGGNSNSGNGKANGNGRGGK